MHASFLMLTTTPALTAMSVLDVFALLVAGLCHDIDHPGHTNDFEIKSRTKLALVHSDDAVLERHHAHIAYSLLWKDENNIFGAVTKEDQATVSCTRRVRGVPWRPCDVPQSSRICMPSLHCHLWWATQLRKTIIHAILSTEMSRHNHMIGELTKKAASRRGSSGRT